MMKPRTRLSALKHILNMLDACMLGAGAGRAIGGCMYRFKGSYCAVGCLFTEAQLDDIRKVGLNNVAVDELAKYVGEENLKYMTGMTLDELSEMQRMHDSAFDRYGDLGSFRKYLLQEIAEERLTSLHLNG